MNSTRSSVMCQVMLVSTERHGHGRGSGLPVPMGGGGRWHLRTLAASSWAAGGAADCGHGELCPLLSLICFLEWLGGREAAAVVGRGGRRGWDGACGGPTLTRLFSFRAFYLERSNLPTDASTTAVKIDQVCPLVPHLPWSLGRAGGSPGQTGARVTPQPECWLRHCLCSPFSRTSPAVSGTLPSLEIPISP